MSAGNAGGKGVSTDAFKWLFGGNCVDRALPYSAPPSPGGASERPLKGACHRAAPKHKRSSAMEQCHPNSPFTREKEMKSLSNMMVNLL